MTLALRARRAGAAFWREWAYETRRLAGDERLPLEVRARLREATQRALGRSARLTPPAERYPRRRLRERMTAAPRAVAGTPVVVLAVRRALETFGAAVEYLRANGYQVLEVPSPDPSQLRAARFAVVDSLDDQRAADAVSTPCLALNVDDAIAGYPIHPDSVYALRLAIDLDTGETVPVGERVSGSYYRNLRNIGFRHLRAEQVLEAVREMHAGVTGGWDERDSQRRFRAAAAAAATSLAPRVPAVAAWGADDGFLGDGRLAAFQAEDVG